MKPVIQVEHLSKKYVLKHQADGAHYKTFRETLVDLPKRLFAPSAPESREEFWALDDVSFNVMPGERVGIIGRNGAGKSTLLKLLSRITEPTKGKITLRGRVASLLEVGTGFHPELTGRENIFLNGAILGMHRREIQRKFDEIVDFSGVEKFLNTPVKRYSSGMYVRLAFSVAAHLEPEILIVDEVLAVGDAEFQKKCLGKMEEVSQGQGRTVLFVSHNAAAVKRLCGRGLLLENGCIALNGNVNTVLQAYSQKGQTNNSFSCIKINHAITLDMVSFRAEKESVNEIISVDDNFYISLTLSIYANCAFGVNCGVTNCVGDVVFMSFSELYNWAPPPNEGVKKTLHCAIPRGTLNTGSYSLSIVFFDTYHSCIAQIEDMCVFNIGDGVYARRGYTGHYTGFTRPNLKWRVEDV